MVRTVTLRQRQIDQVPAAVYLLFSLTAGLGYVGSAANPLKRLVNHLTAFRSWCATGELRCTSVIVLAHDDWDIKLLELVEDPTELRVKEQHWIDVIPDSLTLVNCCRAFRTREQLREQHRVKNAQRVVCELCGTEVNRGNLRNHQRRKICHDNRIPSK
jgi:hypothetical protein